MSIWIPLGLMVLGLVLIMAEVLLPSLGLLSILAGACLIGSLVAAFRISPDVGVNFVLASAVLIPLSLTLSMKLVPKSPLGKKMVASGLSFDSTPVTDPRELNLKGQRGVVESPLRPAGMARLDGRRVDVVSRGELLDVGTAIEVIEVQGNRVVVAQVREEPLS